ncbi:MAG TPA: hypothetical protein V6D09_25335 [Leptolyngbyaceae cyanobacterium]
MGCSTARYATSQQTFVERRSQVKPEIGALSNVQLLTNFRLVIKPTLD